MRVSFHALTFDGRHTAGLVEAHSLQAALAQLKRQGLTPLEAHPLSGKHEGLAPSSRLWAPPLAWRAHFSRQLATLLAAGIPLDRSLALLEEQSTSKNVTKYLANVREAVVGGHTLSESLQGAHGGFRADEIGLLKAGEQAGSPVSMLEELAVILERRIDLRDRLFSTLTYPLVLLVMSFVALGVIAVVLVPSIEPMFKASRTQMPTVLSLLSAISVEFEARGLLWLGTSVIVASAVALFCNKAQVRAGLAALAVELPPFRIIARHLDAWRICHSLGALLKGGASLQTAMASVAEVSIMQRSMRQILAAREAVAGGETLGAAMGAIDVMSPEALQMIAVGEETNSLQAILKHIGEIERKAAEQSIERLSTALNPFLTLIVGGLVGGLIVSVMGALLALNDIAAP